MSVCPVCSSEIAADQFCLRCSPTTVGNDAISASGDLFAGRYCADSELGRGGFGVVFRATDQRLKRPVALKVLKHPKAGSDRSILARFERESLILASLDHPNIIPIYDAGVHDETAYIVMKLVEGRPLSDIEGKSLPASEALRYVAEIADAVAHAHSKGVLHRDIKPSNILVSDEGWLYLVDFGISTAGFLPNITEQGQFLGTLHYMAPEATRGEAIEQSDIYSLGVLLHELTFGRLLFEAGSAAELIHKICYSDPPIVVTSPADGTEEVVALIRQMIARDPARRIASASDLVERIRSLMKDPGSMISSIETAAYPASSSIEQELDQFSDAVQKIIDGVETSSDDDLLETCSRVVLTATPVLRTFERAAQSNDPASTAAAALSFLFVARELHRAVLERASSSGLPLRAFALHLQHALVDPLQEICSILNRPAIDDPFTLEPHDLPDENRLTPKDWKAFLVSEDELERHEALMALLGPGQAELLVSLSRTADNDRKPLIRELWRNVHVLMVEGRARSAPVIDAIRALTEEDEGGAEWRLLASLFRRHGSSYWDPVIVETSIGNKQEEDQRVFGRCLLIHPSEEYRLLGLRLCRPDDLWYVITNPMTPLGWHLTIWRHVADDVTPDFLKVVFVCLRDRLFGEVDRELFHAVELLKAFYEVNAFHEDAFFRMLSELDKRIRATCERQNFRIDLDADYMNRMKAFFSGGVRKERDVEEWSKVPLPIQRRIARAGHFIQHFSCHPLDTIAMECLPHILKVGNARPFVEQAAINARLIGELAKVRRLFESEEARFALVKNPKTPAFIVMKHISFLRRDNLKKIAEAREGNQFSRRTAEKMLGRR